MLEAISYGHGVVSEIVNFIENFREEALTMGLAKEKFVPEIADPENEMLRLSPPLRKGWTRIAGVSAKGFQNTRGQLH